MAGSAALSVDVGEDGLDVIIIFQNLDEVVDFHQLRFCERLGIVWDSLKTCLGDFHAQFFHGGGEGSE